MMVQGGQDATTKLFQPAVELVLKDKSFGIPSRPAVRAHELVRVEFYRPHCESFSAEFVGSLQECCVRLQRERMWENYFKFRSSEKFKEDWALFVTHFDSSEGSCPAFYQFVTDAVLDDIIKRTYPIDRFQQEKQPSLYYKEQNVIRYTAGYVTRALTQKIQRSAHPLKQELILCLNELTKDEVDMDTEHPC